MWSSSIALCTYNGAAYLEEQLESFQRQTRLPTELVVRDDGSTDKTVSLLDSFVRVAPFPVRIYRSAGREGHESNFVACAGLCASDLIFFSDQDDVWFPEKIEAVTRTFDDPDVMLVHHHALTADASGKSTGDYIRHVDYGKHTSLDNAHPWRFPNGFTEAFRRSLTRFNGLHRLTSAYSPRDPFMPHDEWYYLLAISLGSATFLPRSLALHREHKSNLTGERFTSEFSQTLDISGGPKASVGRMFGERVTRCAVIEQVFYEIEQSRMVEAEVKEKASAARRHWKDVGERYRLRERVWLSTSRLGRLKSLLQLLGAQGYGAGGNWSLGRRALIADLRRTIFLT